jgi:hypothetical protein
LHTPLEYSGPCVRVPVGSTQRLWNQHLLLHHLTEILLKVVLNTINQTIISMSIKMCQRLYFILVNWHRDSPGQHKDYEISICCYTTKYMRSMSVFYIFYDFISNDLSSVYLPCMVAFHSLKAWSWSYCSWIYNCLCNQYLSPLMLWVRIPYSMILYQMIYLLYICLVWLHFIP